MPISACRQSPGSFDRTVFVVAAGNGVADTGTDGLDLTSELRQLRAAFPAVFPSGQGPHMIVVGGTQQGSTGVDTGFNYSTDGMDIVYAPGRSVQVSASGCNADGTSFAAPAVSNLIARVLAANPNATVAHVTRAFMNAYMVKGYKLPTVSDVTAQLAGNCSYSISPASGSFHHHCRPDVHGDSGGGYRGHRDVERHVEHAGSELQRLQRSDDLVLPGPHRRLQFERRRVDQQREDDHLRQPKW